MLWLSGYPVIRLPDYPVTRLSGYPVIRLSGYPVPGYPVSVYPVPGATKTAFLSLPVLRLERNLGHTSEKNPSDCPENKNWICLDKKILRKRAKSQKVIFAHSVVNIMGDIGGRALTPCNMAVGTNGRNRGKAAYCYCVILTMSLQLGLQHF